jgi:hypothetical protein
MELNKVSFERMIVYYQPLLERYARFILKDAEIAISLVKKVLEDQYEFNDFVPSTRLRKILKADLLYHCYYWQQSQIFDRPLIKVPLRQYAKPSQILHE